LSALTWRRSPRRRRLQLSPAYSNGWRQLQTWLQQTLQQQWQQRVVAQQGVLSLSLSLPPPRRRPVKVKVNGWVRGL
jgi:hypothetical protein